MLQLQQASFLFMFILYFYIVIFIRETLVKSSPDKDDMLEEDFFSSVIGRIPFLRNVLLGSVWGQLIFFLILKQEIIITTWGKSLVS